MNKRPGDNNVFHGKPQSKQISLMDLFFEEEESEGTADYESFGEILNREDIKHSSHTDIVEKPIDSDVTPEEAEKTKKDKISKSSKKEVMDLNDLNIPDDVVQMINSNDFYPFGCKGMKKNIVTTNRLLYILQRMNTVSMEQCTAVTNDDSRRIYDIMNVLAELGLVEKITGSTKGVFHYKKEKRRKMASGFRFCSNVTTDKPIDFKELRKYMT